jgi:outer membrane protein assembly factor BamB
VFYAFDAATGTIRWSYDIRPDKNSSFHGDPIVTDDLVIFDADLPPPVGHVYAVERTTGKLRWKFKADDGVPTDLVRLGSRVYAVTSTDTLLALDIDTGRLNWTFTSGASDTGRTQPQAPAVAPDRVLFGSRDGFVHALEPGTGRVLWKQDVGARVSTSLTVIQNDLYLGTSTGDLYRLDVDAGTVKASLRTPGVPYGTPTLVQDSLLVVAYKGKLLSLDPSLKGVRWERSGGNWTRPRAWRQSVLVGNATGELVAFRLSDGEPEWSHKLKGIITSIGSTGGLLYIGTQEGTIYAFRPPT